MKKLILLLFILKFSAINSQWKVGHYTDEFGDKIEATYKYLNAFGTFSNSAVQNEKLMCELKISDGDDLYIIVYEYEDKLATFIDSTWENVKLKTPDGKVHNFGAWFSEDGSIWFTDGTPFNANDTFDKNTVTKNNYTRIMKALQQKGVHKIIFNRTSDISSVDSSYILSFTINSGF